MRTDRDCQILDIWNAIRDVRLKDKALNRKSKLIKRLREENAELVKRVEHLEYELVKEWERDPSLGEVTLEQIKAATNTLRGARHPPSSDGYLFVVNQDGRLQNSTYGYSFDEDKRTVEVRYTAVLPPIDDSFFDDEDNNNEP